MATLLKEKSSREISCSNIEIRIINVGRSGKVIPDLSKVSISAPIASQLFNELVAK